MAGNPVEGTVVITGSEQVIARSIAHIENTRKWIGIVGDSALPGAHVHATTVFASLLDAKKRGVRIRFITEVTPENIENCRKVMQYADLRHLDGIKGHFGASESAYLATTTIAEDETIPQMIFSTS